MTRYPPVGRCIYCGSVDPPLTDEHIIPEGLGGREILAAASCLSCAKVTCRFEGSVMRGSTWALRQALGMRGLKRPFRPEITVTVIDSEGASRREAAHHHQMPMKAILPSFSDPPGILMGKRRSGDVELELKVFCDAGKLADEAIPETQISITPSHFARMIAKIAHAKAVQYLGYGAFVPFLPPVILGKDRKWGYLIGRCPEDDPPPANTGHSVFLRFLAPPHDGLLLGRVHLFSPVQGVTYDVVIGQMLEPR
jgi:hypothetical protein